MAEGRYVKSRFWSDSWVEGLSTEAKLFYLYLITNEHTTIAGCYELTTARMAAESGLPESTVKMTLDAFCQAGKVAYVDGWVILRNFMKHQKNWSETVQKGAQRIREALPGSVRDAAERPYTGPIQALPIGHIGPMYIPQNLVGGLLNNSDSDNDTESDYDSDSDGAACGELVDNPEAAAAGSERPAAQPPDSPEIPLPEPSIPLDGLPPNLRARVDQQRRRKADQSPTRRTTGGERGRAAQPRAGPAPPELESFDEEEV